MSTRKGPGLMAVAIVCAAAAAAVGYASLRTLSERAVSARTRDFRDVVVTNTDLSYGVKLDRAMLRVVRLPREGVPAGAFGSIDSVQGQITKVFMSAREPVTTLKLSSKGGGLSMLIRPDMRAVSIEVNQVSGVSGFVLPGDRVDVLSTLDPRRDGQEAFTSTLLQSVEVLAAGQKTQQNENRPLTVQSVTLLVDPRGAEMLAHAQNQGELHLVLRNPDDQTQSSVASFTTRELLRGVETPEPVAMPEIAVASTPPPPPVVKTPRARARVRSTVTTPVAPARPAPPTHIRIIRSTDVVETPAVQDSTRH